jgi:hypothetical protein
MQFSKNQKLTISFLLFFSMIFLSSCLTSKKMNAYISDQYNNEIPKVNKRRQSADITYSSALPASQAEISTTESHTKVLPLILYWVIDDRHTVSLNSGIATAGFSNIVNEMANKGLSQKLNGEKLELTVEQAPSDFALVDKTHAIWLLIYAIHWDKVYIEPQAKDLVVSYKLFKNDSVLKTGRITIKNAENSKNLRFFQSWKSALSEHLSDYDSNIAAMTKQFVDQLTQQL